MEGNGENVNLENQNIEANDGNTNSEPITEPINEPTTEPTQNLNVEPGSYKSETALFFQRFSNLVLCSSCGKASHSSWVIPNGVMENGSFKL